jgi:hypothetical protein
MPLIARMQLFISESLRDQTLKSIGLRIHIDEESSENLDAFERTGDAVSFVVLLTREPNSGENEPRTVLQ